MDGEAIEQRIKEQMLDGLRNEINRAKSRAIKASRARFRSAMMEGGL